MQLKVRLTVLPRSARHLRRFARIQQHVLTPAFPGRPCIVDEGRSELEGRFQMHDLGCFDMAGRSALRASGKGIGQSQSQTSCLGR